MIISFLFPTVVKCLIWKELLEFLCFVSALNPGLQEWVPGSYIHALPHTKKIMFSCRKITCVLYEFASQVLLTGSPPILHVSR